MTAAALNAKSLDQNSITETDSCLAQWLCPHLEGPEHCAASHGALQLICRSSALQHNLRHDIQDHQDVDTANVQDQLA